MPTREDWWNGGLLISIIVMSILALEEMSAGCGALTLALMWVSAVFLMQRMR